MLDIHIYSLEKYEKNARKKIISSTYYMNLFDYSVIKSPQ